MLHFLHAFAIRISDTENKILYFCVDFRESSLNSTTTIVAVELDGYIRGMIS